MACFPPLRDPRVVPRAMSVFTKAIALCAAPFAAVPHAAPASTPDLSFGAGTAQPSFPSAAMAMCSAAWPSSQTAASCSIGYCVVAGRQQLCMARLLDNGTLDTSFGTGGKVTTAIGPNQQRSRQCNGLLPDGRIVLAGTCHNGNDFDICVARYPAMAASTQFNSTGKRVLPGDGTRTNMAVPSPCRTIRKS